MEKRRTYWYSIIKYVADFTKGEPLNVGIYIEEENTNYINYLLIEHDNSKLKAIFENKIQADVYKYSKEYFDYLLSKISKNEYPTNSVSDSILSYLIRENDLPKGIILSEPQFAKTSDVKSLFDSLAINYIGKKFLPKKNEAKKLIIKDRANSIFAEANLLNKKIKSNVRLTPSPNLPFKYQIDYVYSSGNKIDIIHTAPENIDLLPAWFEKVNVFSTKFSKSDKISLLFDSSVDSELLSDTQSVVSTLIQSDKRIEAIDIRDTNNSMNELVSNIKDNALNIDELEKLIAV